MNRTAVRLTRMSFIVLAAAALAGCSMPPSADEAPIRVGTYNIRLSGGVSHVADAGTPNTWEQRKADLVALLRSLDLDVFGLQEVCPDQAAYLRENLPGCSDPDRKRLRRERTCH